ncbi:MAG: M15 family metallopeptidase [Erysipelothrix sp.]|nr:M15 family metallopeptidase [Erysipelothrix sp.]
MKRMLWLLSFLILLASCSTNNRLTFQDNIVIEYGETINPINWVKTGRFDTIVTDVDPEKLGPQEIVITSTYQNKKSEYPMTIQIRDTKGPHIEELKTFEAPLYSEIQISEFFHATDLRDGNVPVEHTPLDTSRLGGKRVLVWAVDAVGNRTQFEVLLNVVDVNPPIISQKSEFLIKKNEELNIHDFFLFKDEQKENLNVEIQGDYDLSEVGSYPLVISATDPSGNNNQLETVLVVYQEADESMDGYQYIEDANIREDRYTLVNMRYQLPYDYVPNNLVLFPSDYRLGNASGTLETVAAFVEMAEAAQKDNISLVVEHGYISYWNQSSLYNAQVAKVGLEETDKQFFRAGHSEHQLGVAIDICSDGNCEASFSGTAADRWLRDNASNYGFILRYPRGKEANTGMNYKSFHYRYVGKEAASEINKTGLSFEEFFYQFSDYLK